MRTPRSFLKNKTELTAGAATSVAAPAFFFIMRWFLYNVLFTLGYLTMVPHFLLRMWRRGGYRNRFNDRFGRYPAAIENALRAMHRPVWIHAVSVGEVYVAGQVMRAMRQQNPQVRFVLSTTSSTGWREAEKQITAQDQLIFCPLDFPSCVKRALTVVQPALFIFTESEIWPNLIRACAARAIPLFLVNARVSDKSAPGYRRLRFWFGPVLRMFTTIFAQSEMDKQRLIAAGACPATIDVTGSFKFDVACRNSEKEVACAAFLAQYGVEQTNIVLLGGSTWPGEDSVLISIFKELCHRFPVLRLVIVPRHFEKADAVQAEIEKAGFVCVRKSRVAGNGAATPSELRSQRAVILVDTTGELMGFYGNADVVFVGKSLCEHGSQNMIEPCLCGAATVVGPYTENFRPVMADLLDAEAVVQVSSAAELAREIERLVADAKARQKVGTAGTLAVERRKGVVTKVAALLNRAVSRSA